MRSVDKAGEHVREQEYGPDGRLARAVARSAGGAPRVVETHEYDAAGRRTKTFYADAPPNALMGFGVEGSDSAYSAAGATAVRTLYNEREKPATMIFLDAAGRELSRVELIYDANGNLIEEAQTRTMEMLPAEALAGMNEAQRKAVQALFGSALSTHRYDENGRRVETRSGRGRLGDDRRTMAYNEHGDLVGETSEHVMREYNLDDEGRLSDTPTKEDTMRSEARIQYEYDARGNWVTKTVESRGGPDQEFFVSSVERREIDYFE